MVASTCFGITLPSLGSVPSAFWDAQLRSSRQNIVDGRVASTDGAWRSVTRHNTMKLNFMLCWPYITVYQYNETTVMQFLFNLFRIRGLYMFRALRPHPQAALHKRHLVYCVRVMSVGYGTVAVPRKREKMKHSETVGYRGGGVFNSPPGHSQILIKRSRIPCSVENTFATT
jgi:hypothetical protein